MISFLMACGDHSLHRKCGEISWRRKIALFPPVSTWLCTRACTGLELGQASCCHEFLNNFSAIIQPCSPNTYYILISSGSLWFCSFPTAPNCARFHKIAARLHPFFEPTWLRWKFRCRRETWSAEIWMAGARTVGLRCEWPRVCEIAIDL